MVEQIADEAAATWDFDAHSYRDDADGVLALSLRVRKAFQASEFDASDTLVTKTMLGVFGCIPAFDRNFRSGFHCQTLCRRALWRIGEYYEVNRAGIDAAQVSTLDFVTGQETGRPYSRAKIIDMVFFQEGINRVRVTKHS